MSRATDIAWAAGLFEGEGCISLDRPRHRRDPSKRYNYALMTLGSTDEDVVRRFHRIVGVGNIIVSDHETKRNPKHKRQWRWRTTSDGVRTVAALIKPYLSERRASRLDEVLRTAGLE